MHYNIWLHIKTYNHYTKVCDSNMEGNGVEGFGQNHANNGYISIIYFLTYTSINKWKYEMLSYGNKFYNIDVSIFTSSS